jgi:hypothetical protein
MRLKPQLKARLMSDFGAEVFQKYGMCDPRMSPAKSLREHMTPSEAKVSREAVQYCIRSLQTRRVRSGGKLTFGQVISTMDLSTSGGFGYTTTAQHKIGLVLSYDEAAYKEYQVWYDSLPEGEFSIKLLRTDQIIPKFITAVKVKEEVSKQEKIDRGDHRTFFCVPFDQIVESKREQETLNCSFTERGFTFKGQDPRTSIRELYLDCRDHPAYQGDASSLDRTISKPLLGQAQAVRSGLGATPSKGMLFATLNPVVFFVDEDGEYRLCKLQRPQVSGRDSTTEDDLLCIYLVVCEYMVRKGISYDDFWFTGVGDDWTLLIENESFVLSELVECFTEHDIKMKAWRVESMEDFHFLGADIVQSAHGPQPVWDLYRSVVRLSYRSRKETDFVYAMRIVGVLSYNVYHREAGKLLDYLKDFMRRAKINNMDREIVWRTVREMPTFYVRPECSRISVGGTKFCYGPDMAGKKNSLSKRFANVVVVQQKKRAGKPSRPKPKKNVKGKAKGMIRKMGMDAGDPCVKNFLHALVHPFGASNVCLPVGEKRASIRSKTTTRGIFSNSTTTGVGWICFAPSAANDYSGVRFTDSSYAGTAATAITATTGSGVTLATVQGGLSTSANFDAAVAVCKPAMAALRIRYIGNELEKGGRVIAFNDQEDFTVIGMTLNDIRSRPTAKSLPISREWQTISCFTTIPRVAQFVNGPAPWDYAKSATVTANSSPLMFGIESYSATKEQLFEFESVFHFEQRVQTLNSLNHSEVMAPTLGDIAKIEIAEQTVQPTAGNVGERFEQFKAAASEVGGMAARFVEALSVTFDTAGGTRMLQYGAAAGAGYAVERGRRRVAIQGG